MRLVFDHSWALSSSISMFYFKPEQRLRYVAGQFVELLLPHADMDGRGNRRIFTLITTPDKPLIGIAAAFPQPVSSFKRALRALQPGDTVQVIGEPMGDFILPKDPAIPMVWMAGGVAAASFAGMAQLLANAPGTRHITLFQSARYAEDIIFTDVWRQAGIVSHTTVTGPAQEWKGRNTRFSAAELLQAAPHGPERTLFYISGSDNMVEQLCKALVGLGVPRTQIVREAYSGY